MWLHEISCDHVPADLFADKNCWSGNVWVCDTCGEQWLVTGDPLNGYAIVPRRSEDDDAA